MAEENALHRAIVRCNPRAAVHDHSGRVECTRDPVAPGLHDLHCSVSRPGDDGVGHGLLFFAFPVAGPVSGDAQMAVLPLAGFETYDDQGVDEVAAAVGDLARAFAAGWLQGLCLHSHFGGDRPIVSVFALTTTRAPTAFLAWTQGTTDMHKLYDGPSYTKAVEAARHYYASRN